MMKEKYLPKKIVSKLALGSDSIALDLAFSFVKFVLINLKGSILLTV